MNLLDPNVRKDIDIAKAKVEKLIGNNIYKIKDINTGRFYNVYSSSARKKGDMVRVSKGTVVGASKVVTKTKIVSI